MHRLPVHALALSLSVLALRPEPLRAQASAAPDPSKARVRFGPIFLNPSLSLTHLGLDDNVFNEPDELAPKRDFTLTLQLTTDVGVRIGRAWLLGGVTEELVYYKRYASERAVNSAARQGVLVPLNRMTLSGNVTYLNTHSRPGFEIDARSHRTEIGGDARAEVRALAKTFVGARASRTTTEFSRAVPFEGVGLADALNRTVTAGGLDSMTSAAVHG